MFAVSPRLFISDATAAQTESLLLQNSIKAVLTVMDYPLSVEYGFVDYKWIELLDISESDLLSHFDACFFFINGHIENQQSVLVHCFAGRSRSATVVCAFLMKKLDISYMDALSMVSRTSPSIRPNPGFLEQLMLYDKMGKSISHSNQMYKLYKLKKWSDNMESFGPLPNHVWAPDPAFHDSGVSLSQKGDSGGVKDSAQQVGVFKCKKCRRAVFYSTSLVEHEKTSKSGSFKNRKLGNKKGLTTGDANCSSFFVEPVKWMEILLLGVTSGKLCCPKCQTKLGAFNWSGQQCSCSAWVCPSFQIHKTSVDFSPKQLAAL